MMSRARVARGVAMWHRRQGWNDPGNRWHFSVAIGRRVGAFGLRPLDPWTVVARCSTCRLTLSWLPR